MNKIMPDQQPSNYNTFVRFFLLLFLPLCLFLSLLIIHFYKQEVQADHAITESQERDGIDQQLDIIEAYFHVLKTDLLLLSRLHESKLISGADQKRRSIKDLSQDFFNFIATKGCYDQARLLNTNGFEVVRANYNNGSPRLVPSSLLQNKKNRYYFADTLALERGQIYVSPMDLNFEQGKLEWPLKPVIRLGTPVFNDANEKKGVVLLNYLAGDLLKRIRSPATGKAGNMLLINSDGYYLVGLKPVQEWGFMLADRADQNMGRQFSKEWRTIEERQHGQFHSDSGLFTFTTIWPLSEDMQSSTGTTAAYAKSGGLVSSAAYHWKLVSYLPRAVLHKSGSRLIRQYLQIWGLINSLVVVGCLLLAWAWARQRCETEMLRRTRASLEDVLSISAPICITSIDRDIIFANKSYEQTFGAVFDGAGGSTKCFDSRPGERCHSAHCPLRLIQEGKEHVTCEVMLKTKGGDSRRFVLTAQPFHGPKGTLMGIMETFQDITSHKGQEEAKQQKRQLESLGVLAGGIAHDFNNLLTAIVGNISLAESMLPQGEESVRGFLKQGEEASMVAKKLTRRIIAFSKGGAITKSLTYAANLLDDALKHTLSQSETSYKASISGNLWPILADEGQIMLGLHEIIKNASESMDGSGEIELRAENVSLSEEQCLSGLEPGAHIRITIRDQGRGVDEEDRGRLFDPYFSSKQTFAQKGLGLGLTTAFAIIEKHDGSIQISSEKGEGTTVEIYLPAVAG